MKEGGGGRRGRGGRNKCILYLSHKAEEVRITIQQS
jgi:hypothetical protein